MSLSYTLSLLRHLMVSEVHKMLSFYTWPVESVEEPRSWTDEQKLISLFKQCCNNGHAKVNLCISKSGYST
jgi:hypothetical protein